MSTPTKRAWAVSCLLTQEDDAWTLRGHHTMQVIHSSSEDEAKGAAIGRAMEEYKGAALRSCLSAEISNQTPA